MSKNPARRVPSYERVRELFDYRDDGELIRRTTVRFIARRGTVAGTLSSGGYKRVCVDGLAYGVHQVIWLWHHGVWPADEIDHVNCLRADNRIGNLREATKSQNARNTRRPCTATGPYKGVTFAHGRWQAQIGCDGKNLYLGLFDTAEEAHEAYRVAAVHHFGDFARVS